MEITRTTDILVETKRKFIIRHPPTDAQILCERCAGQMITAEATAVLFAVSRRVVYRLIENEAIHFFETEAGAIFVCPQSLDAAIRNTNGAPPVEVVKTLANSPAESPVGETEI